MVKTKEIIPYYKFKDEPSLYTNEALKKTLKLHYGKIGAGNKAVLFNKVKLCLENVSLKNNVYLKEITKIQSFLKGNIVRNQLKLCNLNPSVTKQLTNDCDFLTCNHWKKDLTYFFSYKDRDNFHYYFDIRSFRKLLTHGNKNPYNRQKIPLHIINRVKKRIKYLKSKNISISIEDEPELDINTPAGLKRTITDIFIEMSSNGFTINIEWFTNLAINRTKLLYQQLEDIWNYRTELTLQAKRKIAPPNGRLFATKPQAIFIMDNKLSVQKALIPDIKRLVMDGETIDDRKLGMMYFIIALSEISHECMVANPWASLTNPH